MDRSLICKFCHSEYPIGTHKCENCGASMEDAIFRDPDKAFQMLKEYFNRHPELWEWFRQIAEGEDVLPPTVSEQKTFLQRMWEKVK